MWADIGRRATRQYSSLLVQSRPDKIGDLDQVFIDRKLHDALESEWTDDQNSDTAPERISSDPRFVGIPHVFPTCRNGGFDPLAAGRRDSFGVEDGQGHFEP